MLIEYITAIKSNLCYKVVRINSFLEIFKELFNRVKRERERERKKYDNGERNKGEDENTPTSRKRK